MSQRNKAEFLTVSRATPEAAILTFVPKSLYDDLVHPNLRLNVLNINIFIKNKPHRQYIYPKEKICVDFSIHTLIACVIQILWHDTRLDTLLNPFLF